MGTVGTILERNYPRLVGLAAIGFCVLVVLSLVDRTAGPGGAQDGERRGATKWEYRVEFTNSSLETGTSDEETEFLQNLLNNRGTEGWEFVGRVSSYHADRYSTAGEFPKLFANVDASWFVFRRAKQ